MIKFDFIDRNASAAIIVLLISLIITGESFLIDRVVTEAASEADSDLPKNSI